MRRIGNDIYLQRGENWSLDFDIKNKRGDPYMLLNIWKNPYLAITITAARYGQEGDFRRTYWLDLTQRWVEDQYGDVRLVPVKRFISTEALPIKVFSVGEVIAIYGTDRGGRIVLDESSDFDVTNYLFFVDAKENDERIYKYVKSYTLDEDGYVVDEEWEEYSFRIIKQFVTKDWVEQSYLFDMKVLAGESIEEYVADTLDDQGTTHADFPWSDADTEMYIELIDDTEIRNRVREVFESGMPLMPDYDTKLLVLEPTNMYISANIQGGVK